uniref:Helitron_like_N domain-containing protein n=1 Tax=Heterorhabditis bacteriophora TaxID=37862 RepID=A0A1I7WSU6_HETBA
MITMIRTPKLSLQEKSQIKALSTIGYTMKQTSKLNDCRKKGKFYGLRKVAQLAPMKPVGLVALMFTKLQCRECWTSCPQLTQDHEDERFRWVRIFMRCDWEKVTLLRVLKNKPTSSLFRIQMVLTIVTPIGTIYVRNPDTSQSEISTSQCYGTGRLGVCLDEDEHHGLPGFPYLQRLPGFSFTFQQNNAIIYASRSTKTWLKNGDVDTLD